MVSPVFTDRNPIAASDLPYNVQLPPVALYPKEPQAVTLQQFPAQAATFATEATDN